MLKYKLGRQQAMQNIQSILREFLKTREQKQSGSKTLSQILLKHLRMTFTLLVKLKNRTDWSCDQSQAQSLVTSITGAFPEYSSEDLLDNPQHCVGVYDAYRPPYADGTISYYFLINQVMLMCWHLTDATILSCKKIFSMAWYQV